MTTVVKLGPDDSAIVYEMQEAARAAIGGTAGRAFDFDTIGQGGTPDVRGWKTSKPDWMRKGDTKEYYEIDDVIEVLEKFTQGHWPTTKGKQKIAEHLLERLRNDVENEKARVYHDMDMAARSEAEVLEQQRKEDELFRKFSDEVDRLSAEESRSIVIVQPGENPPTNVPYRLGVGGTIRAPNSSRLHPDPSRSALKQVASDDPGMIVANTAILTSSPQAERLLDAYLDGGKLVARKMKSTSNTYIVDKRGKIAGYIDSIGGLNEFVDVPIERLEPGETAERGMPQYEEKVSEYAKLTTKPPLISVHGVRHEGDTYQIINGHHRWQAAKRRGDKTMRVDANLVYPDGQMMTIAHAGQESGIPDSVDRFKVAAEAMRQARGFTAQPTQTEKATPAPGARPQANQPEMFTGREMIGPAITPGKMRTTVPQSATGDELLAGMRKQEPEQQTVLPPQAGTPAFMVWWKSLTPDQQNAEVAKRRMQLSGGIDPAPPFYSQLQRTVEEKLPNRVDPKQAMAVILSGPVKLDEIKWTGIGEWLSQQKGPVSKQEVLNFLRDNRVEVKEIEKTAEPGVTDKRGYPVGTKFGSYTLPGGTNYREVLFQLPGAKPELPDGWKMDNRQGYWWVYDDKGELVNYSVGRAAAVEGARKLRGMEASGFRSSHWDEPNVLAHVRLNDRVGPNGEKILFIEELQSDWHQAGKREGYGLVPVELPEGYDVRQTGGRFEIWGPDASAPAATGATRDEAVLNYRNRMQFMGAAPGFWKHKGVPPAPFSKTWHELVMKRMLRYAAEHGYDKLAWITGEQTAERYDLSKRVDRIGYVTQDGGRTFNVAAYIKGGGEAIEKSGITPSQIADFIGKDAADKITRYEGEQKGAFVEGARGGELLGANLKVGGEWATHLYDQMIPQFLNSYGKKWGARVGETTFDAIHPKKGEYALEPVGNRMERFRVHSIPITPDMKHSVLFKGQALFGLIPPAILGYFSAQDRERRAQEQR
jgi:hypothetical protein